MSVRNPGRRPGSIRERVRRGKTFHVARLWVTQNGMRRRLEAWCATPALAQKKLRDWERAEEDRMLPSPERETVAAYLEWWIHHVAKKRVEPSTFVRYEALIRKHLLAPTARLPLSEVDGSPAAVLDLYDTIAKTSHPLKATKTRPIPPRVKTSADTVKKCHAVLRVALEDAVVFKKLRLNGAAMIPRRLKPKSKPREKEPYTVAEMRKFLKAAVGDRLEFFYIVALTTQMREGELLALSPADLDLKSARAIFVHRSMQDIEGNQRRINSTTKSQDGRRRIDLPAIAVAALREQKRQLERDGLSFCGLVFPDTTGKPMRRQNLLRRHLYPLMERAGLRQIEFHTLRHSGNSALAERVPLVVLQHRLGHSNEAMTKKYTHRTPGMGSIAVDELEKIFPVDRKKRAR